MNWMVAGTCGKTGVLYRGKFVTEPLTSWHEFVTSFKDVLGKTVGLESIRWKNVMTMPLRDDRLVNRLQVDKADLDQVRTILLGDSALRLSSALEQDTYQNKLSGEDPEQLCLDWTGPLASCARDSIAGQPRYANSRAGTGLALGARRRQGPRHRRAQSRAPVPGFLGLHRGDDEGRRDQLHRVRHPE
ncbi:MAG: hypothetical protein U0838_10380 [Chloroflexota bacterium]